jgi:MATE family multidrug resistance protein
VKITKFAPFYKRNLKLAFPIILGQLGQITVSLADTLMVGRLGTRELASVAFANSIFLLVFIFALGFSLGLTPLIGNAFGKKQPRKIVLFFQNAFLLNFLLSVAILALSLLLYPFFYNLGQDEEIVTIGIPYFNTLLFSLLPLSIFFTCRQFGDGIGNTKIAMWITLIGNLLNILFNYLLIYGKFGFPEMGVTGAGMATFISRFFMALAFLLVLWKHPVFTAYLRYLSWSNFKKIALLRLIKVGFPISGQLVVEVLAFSFSAVMVGWIDKASLAAHQVVLQMSSATFMMALGVASATTIRISHQFGSKHYRATKFAALAALHVVVLFMSLTAICLVIFRHQIPMLFTTDPQVIAVASKLLIIAGFFQIFDGVQTVGLATLRGLADVRFAMYIAILAYIFISLPIGYVCAFRLNMGAPGIWTGLAIGLFFAAILYRLRFLNYMKRFDRKA